MNFLANAQALPTLNKRAARDYHGASSIREETEHDKDP